MNDLREQEILSGLMGDGQNSQKQLSIDDVIESGLVKARRQREWRRFIIQTLCVMAAVYLLLTLVIGVSVVHGDSMQPTLHNGDVTILWRLSGGYKQGDMVLFDLPEFPEMLVKRIIAVPGDTVDIDNENGYVIVNNTILNEPYIYAGTYSKETETTFPITLGEDEYFVLGDNRTTALDSRSSKLGTVSKSDITGKIILLFRTGS